MTLADRILQYLFDEIKSPVGLSEGVSALNPYDDPETQRVCTLFFRKYYNDDHQRTALIGINPGRFGAGVTGIPFTDPVSLEEFCGISNSFQPKRELSSRFVYDLIMQLGGPDQFYSRFYFMTMFPLALIKDEKNYNYYDSSRVFNDLKNEIAFHLGKQLSLGIDRNHGLCLGKRNLEYLSSINKEHRFFSELDWIEHPRYIQQYKSKHKDEYIQKYKEKLRI